MRENETYALDDAVQVQVSYVHRIADGILAQNANGDAGLDVVEVAAQLLGTEHGDVGDDAQSRDDGQHVNVHDAYGKVYAQQYDEYLHQDAKRQHRRVVERENATQQATLLVAMGSDLMFVLTRVIVVVVVGGFILFERRHGDVVVRLQVADEPIEQAEAAYLFAVERKFQDRRRGPARSGKELRLL